MPTDDNKARLNSTYAKKQRRIMIYSNSDIERRKAARELLTSILGSKLGDKVIEAKRWGHFSGGTPWDTDFIRSYYKHRDSPLKVDSDVDPIVEAAFRRQERDFPGTANQIRGLYKIDPKNYNDRRIAEYSNWSGDIGFSNDKNRSWHTTNEIMAHELSHAVGARDDFDFSEESNKPIGSYDISSAYDKLAPRDINLPNETGRLANYYNKKEPMQLMEKPKFPKLLMKHYKRRTKAK